MSAAPPPTARPTARPGPRRAVFADRDGTLLEEVGYLARAEQMRLLPGVAGALRRLYAAGLPVIVVSNQSGVARGLIDHAFAARGGELLAALLAREHARIAGYYFCPHHPAGRAPYDIACRCRKPAPGMLEQAARERHLTLAGSWLIGDKRSDLECGAELGVIPLLVRTGYGREAERDPPADFAARGGRVFDDFAAAAEWILGPR